MPQHVVTLAYPSRLTFCKERLGWKRALRIALSDTSAGETRQIDFPEGSDRVVVDGLDPHSSYDVRITRAGWLRALVSPDRELALRPVASGPRFIVTGSGRCGTQSIARYLDGLEFEDGRPVRARHETLSEQVLPLIVDGDVAAVCEILSGLRHDIEAAPYLSIVPETLESAGVVHIIRDGRRVVQSGLNRGWFQNDSSWNRIKPRPESDPFRNACHLWTTTNIATAAAASLTVRMEDIVESADARAALLEHLGIRRSGRPFPRANRGRSSSSFECWTDEQRAIFASICGETMDAHYPRWRDGEDT